MHFLLLLFWAEFELYMKWGYVSKPTEKGTIHIKKPEKWSAIYSSWTSFCLGFKNTSWTGDLILLYVVVCGV